MRVRNVLVIVSVLVLAYGSGALALISPGEADFNYEGDAEINGYQHDVGNPDPQGWVQDIYDPNCTWSASGGVATVQLTTADWGSDGAILRVGHKPSDGSGGLQHTIDVRAARPNPAWATVNDTAVGPAFGISAPVDSSSRKYYWVVLGESVKAGSQPDPTNTDQLTVLIWQGAKGSDPNVYEVDGIAGLNVNNMNIYRMAMNAAGDFRIYVNDLIAPVFSMDAMPTYDDDGSKAEAGLFSPRSDAGDTNWQLDIDFMRIKGDQGIFERPIPEPATIGLLAIGGLALLRRRMA